MKDYRATMPAEEVEEAHKERLLGIGMKAMNLLQRVAPLLVSRQSLFKVLSMDNPITHAEYIQVEHALLSSECVRITKEGHLQFRP